jgi:hypothetical protein
VKNRPKLEKISEQMKEWSSVLGEEMKRWPEVTSRNMFGMAVFYRKGVIFAALPRTRSFETPNSVAFKLHRASAKTIQRLRTSASISLHSSGETGWISFGIQDSGDVHRALEWLLEAYESCQEKLKKKNR